jgi:Cytochrome c554 and c-prime
MNDGKENEEKQFAGSASCANCHKEIYNSHIHTAHFLTSGIADEKNIQGDFREGKNEFVFNGNVTVAMEKRPTGLYQVEYVNGIEKRSGKFDVVVGSGTKGQTYLNWNQNRLFQLPITWFTAASQWSNSPGFPDKAVFNRPITVRCLECHSTYAKIISELPKKPDEFDRSAMIYGVDCETCHGPSAEHVAYQTQNPAEKKAKYVINPALLSRQQNLDMCALCHGGLLQKTKPSFSFTAGDALADYFKKDTSVQFSANIDVHGNQLGLLAASKCFIQSTTMTCNSCHNPHVNEAGQKAVFSQRCISCHTTEHVGECKMTNDIGTTIKNNCIDCHMPLEQSQSIVVLLQGADAPTPAKMRSHYIKNYPGETKKFIDSLKNKMEK